jgi:steroid delta-isomerase-like uncharacterized protein
MAMAARQTVLVTVPITASALREAFIVQGTLCPFANPKLEILMNPQTTTLANSPVKATTPYRVLHAVLDAWNRGSFDEAADQFDDQFTFIDHALGLEFKDKERLTEFLAKAREFFPDTQRIDNTIFSSEDGVISEWTLTATLSEPLLGGLMRNVPIRVRGISVVQIQNGKITRWSDYYDQLTSRRRRLAARFTKWIEL